MNTRKLSTNIVAALGLTLGVNLSVLNAQNKMYWTDSRTGKIQRADLDGANVEELVSGLPGPATIALDLRAGKMYWADQIAHKIQRANLDGSHIEDLVTGLSSPYGIALDLGAGQMYWTNVGNTAQIDGTIQRADLDGSNVETFILITGLVDPRGIALDVASRMMYWADTGGHKIQRAFMSGFFVEDVFAPGNDLYSPLQVALDVADGKLYWSAFFFENGVVHRANLDGSNVEPFINTSDGLGGPAIEGLALDLRARVLYFTIGIITPVSQIERVNLDRSNGRELVTGLSFPVGVALDLREPIPTVSTWGMTVMTLLMITAGTIVIAQRRKTRFQESGSVLRTTRQRNGTFSVS